MITYELAKKLEDAGFPQEKTERYDATNYYSGEYVPTLSELIEACGTDFVALVRWETNLWTASNCERDTPMVHKGMEIKTEGSTPEEAVANLWLELNKKNDGKEMLNACYEEVYKKMFPWYVRLWHRIKGLFIKPKFSARSLIKIDQEIIDKAYHTMQDHFLKKELPPIINVSKEKL